MVKWILRFTWSDEFGKIAFLQDFLEPSMYDIINGHVFIGFNPSYERNVLGTILVDV